LKTYIKKFNELTNNELYDILKLRSEIFVVKQKCIYLDMDDIDKHSFHVYLKDDFNLYSYLRLFNDSSEPDVFKIGRVVSKIENKGFGKEVMNNAINYAKNELKAKKIKLNSQVYAQGFYSSLGFKLTKEEYLLDDIPHVDMELSL
jgi:ElaA protein